MLIVQHRTLGQLLGWGHGYDVSIDYSLTLEPLTERAGDSGWVFENSGFEEHRTSFMQIKYSRWTGEANHSLTSVQIIGRGEAPQVVWGIRVASSPVTATPHWFQASASAADHQVKYYLGWRVFHSLDSCILLQLSRHP